MVSTVFTEDYGSGSVPELNWFWRFRFFGFLETAVPMLPVSGLDSVPGLSLPAYVC